MRIEIITPAPASHLGNWVTAERWARILRRLGQEVAIRRDYEGKDCEALVALHARRSFPSIERFHRLHPEKPLLVALTGTDLYHDLGRSEDARLALEQARLLLVLQPEGREALPPELRAKARVIRQSSVPTRSRVPKARRFFDVCVVGHLRPVKDPFRAAEAARLLPTSSRIRIVHAGSALSPEMEERARREMAENPRYRWLGDRPRWQVRRLLARSHAMVLSSEMEGGANVVSEALVSGLPVISTRISGSIGMLGEDHPAYFEVGDTAGLAALLLECERNPAFLEELADRSRRLASLFHPDREVEAWRELLA
ncbi:MAG: TIGR04348 family glycosyltransferase, partial [Acidobacteria bacterium]|nr:TIGR04348 family glycosyltransferase [Acidobacteriota bacterium]